ncbi:hypothetical protein EVAR_31707_1 [Eumeta japonica]|uniref:Secreted protein n=1 Tax=Eumeta variegata TaxID=151549 RepID=A0A4C1VVL4_EUMVA|nr:hypothetical protein EVAR_31707_1 [Eumeta japonica]
MITLLFLLCLGPSPYNNFVTQRQYSKAHSGREIDASQTERLGRLSITRFGLSLARSAQAEHDNASCFFARAAGFHRFIRDVTATALSQGERYEERPTRRRRGARANDRRTGCIFNDFSVNDGRGFDLCGEAPRRHQPVPVNNLRNGLTSADRRWLRLRRSLALLISTFPTKRERHREQKRTSHLSATGAPETRGLGSISPSHDRPAAPLRKPNLPPTAAHEFISSK